MKPQGFQRFMAELYIKRALLTIQFVLVQTKVQHTQLHVSISSATRYNLRRSGIPPQKYKLGLFRRFLSIKLFYLMAMQALIALVI